MEFGSIEREIHIEASPEVVYDVISRPEHLRAWWSDEAELEPVAGTTGFISFGDRSAPGAKVVPLTVLDADPPRRFSFRWAYEEGQAATPTNSLLVVFELVPSGAGTLLRFTESGFRERGWEAAVLEAQYSDHANAWGHFLPRLVTYAASLKSTP
jgi:uncharacterized protein YndB with AHSA1/START domain